MPLMNTDSCLFHIINRQASCGGLKENAPVGHAFEFLILSYLNCLGRMGTCGLVGGDVKLGLSFVV